MKSEAYSYRFCALGVVILLAAPLLMLPVWGQQATGASTATTIGPSYTIPWSAVAGGGQSFSESASYKLGSTIGQHDAGDPSGPTYTVLGGFLTPLTGGDGSAPGPPQYATNETGEANDAPSAWLNRFGRVAAYANSEEFGIRVTPTVMYDTSRGCVARSSPQGDLSQLEGQSRWVGPPQRYADNAIADQEGFIASELQCAFHSQAWDPAALLGGASAADYDENTLYFFDEMLLPCSTYTVEFCSSADPGSCATPLEIQTARYGDVWSPFEATNFTDIQKEVDKFRLLAFSPPSAGAPLKPRAWLRGDQASPGSNQNFTDIQNAVDAFRGTIAYGRLDESDVTALVNECP